MYYPFKQRDKLPDKDMSGNGEPKKKSLYNRITAAINIVCYSLALGQAGMVIKNVYECSPQTNLEYRLTKSDIKQMQYLDFAMQYIHQYCQKI